MKTKIAILGCGKIALRIIKGISYCDNLEIVGFGASDPLRARECCEKYGGHLYGTYDDILNSEEVEAVYVATYNPSHYQLIEKSLNHHKHVMCEKPIVPTISQLDELFELAHKNGCLLMEACKGVFTPLSQKLRQMIADGVFGKIIYAEAAYCHGGSTPDDHWVMDKNTGGSLQDLGDYPVSVLNYVLNAVPQSRQVFTIDHNGVDVFAQAMIDYGDFQGHIHCGFIVDTPRIMRIFGTEGHIEIVDFWKTGKGTYFINGKEHHFDCEMINDFYYECHHFADCIQKGKMESDIMSHEASRNIMKITAKQWE